MKFLQVTVHQHLLANFTLVCLCSYRFMDMFPDTAMIREIQQELDKIIQQGVQNITRLIRASDPTITDTLQTHGSRQVTRGSASSRVTRGQRSSGERLDSSLAGRLVRDGLLTPDLLRQLQREWSKGEKQGAAEQSTLNTEHQDDDDNNKKGKRGKKKK